MVTGFGGSGSAAQIVACSFFACPFFESPASSEGGAADRSEKLQRRRRSAAGCCRQEGFGKGIEVWLVSNRLQTNRDAGFSLALALLRSPCSSSATCGENPGLGALEGRTI